MNYEAIIFGALWIITMFFLGKSHEQNRFLAGKLHNIVKEIEEWVKMPEKIKNENILSDISEGSV